MPDAVGLDGLALRIGGQRDAEVEFVAEGAVLLDAVGRDADDDRAEPPEFGHLVGELDVLERATLGVVLGIEVEHDGVATMVRKTELLGRVGGQLEVGSWGPHGYKRHVMVAPKLEARRIAALPRGVSAILQPVS